MKEKKSIIQSKIFLEGEGNAWFDRSEKSNPTSSYSIPDDRKVLANWCKTRKESISNILEIGAGNGYPLAFLAKELEANAYGIEPSVDALKNWNKNREKLEGGNKTKLEIGIASELPYEDNKFDLVVFGFCLCWIERQSLFRSIAEADRVLRDGGLLAIIDFDPCGPYANPYLHKENLNTYKTNHADIFISSNHYSLMYKHSFSHSDVFFHETIDERTSLSLLFKQEHDVYFQHGK